MPPMTPEAQKRAAAQADGFKESGTTDPETRGLSERCITFGVPDLLAGYNSYFQIIQSPGYVVLLTEKIHDARIIPLGKRLHAPAGLNQWTGDSRGRWEGNTLVVETTNFNDKTRLRYGGSSNTHAVERFTRVSEDLIDYQYTITDPTVYTKPFTVSIPMPKRDDKIFEYACHEGNHSMIGILSGARADEKRAEEAAKAKEVVR
jgi:hypothetical protein